MDKSMESIILEKGTEIANENIGDFIEDLLEGDTEKFKGKIYSGIFQSCSGIQLSQENKDKYFIEIMRRCLPGHAFFGGKDLSKDVVKQLYGLYDIIDCDEEDYGEYE